MTTGNFTKAARAYAEQACYQDENRPIAEAGFRAGWEAARTHLAAQEPTPADSKISGYDLAVLRSTYQAFGTRDSEWGEGAQAGMRAAAAILGITIDEEDYL